MEERLYVWGWAGPAGAGKHELLQGADSLSEGVISRAATVRVPSMAGTGAGIASCSGPGQILLLRTGKYRARCILCVDIQRLANTVNTAITQSTLQRTE